MPRHFAKVPNDSEYANESEYLQAINAPAAWDVQLGSAAVKIAVIDSGADIAHPDLANKIVAEYNAVDGTTDVTDTLGHGTFVAGVAAAATNNSVGVAGAGFDSSLLVVKVADANNDIWVDDEINGIVWAANHGAKVISLSLGSDTASVAERDAVSYAQNRGAVVVAAAGNDADLGNPVQYPAAYPNVIAVGATDARGQRADFSEHGAWVSVAAPGVGIYSTTPTAGSTFFPSTTGYSAGDGTSFSTPLVAGEVALLAAQAPTATATQLRAAVVNSAHGYAGLGLGTGQVDFAAALTHLPPVSIPTITSPTAGSSAAGVVGLAALSTAAKVRFWVDGTAVGSAVAVGSAGASVAWTSYGVVNGTHTVVAEDCNVFGDCNIANPSATIQFALANAAPSLKSPVAGTVVSGPFTLSASASGGGVAFLVDGVRRAFDSSAPYSVAYTGSVLTDGKHTARAVGCSSTGALCRGPASPVVSFTARSLHPVITSIAPTQFSPNGDGVRDTTTVAIRLPDPEVASLRITNAAGTPVRGPIALHTLAAGSHVWKWNGKTGSGARPADGTYTVTITTTKVVPGVTLHGSASRSVRLDAHAPTMSKITGATGFYPYADGYRDTFVPTAQLDSSATLRLYVRNAKGKLVRVLSAARSAGGAALTWTGRDSAGHLVPAGTYRWNFTATDGAGNLRSTSRHSVVVSLKRLVSRVATFTRNGADAYSGGGSPDYCAGVSATASDYPHGLWLLNYCDPVTDDPSAIAAAFYKFTLPSAVQYGAMHLSVYGNSLYPPSGLRSAFYLPAADSFTFSSLATARSHSSGWVTLSGTAVAGHYDGNRLVRAAALVTNDYGAPSDFDIEFARLTVAYKVLG